MPKKSNSSKEKYTDPELREEVKENVKKSSKGGQPGQWSARKAQLMAQEYKKKGGGYKGEKDESQKHIQNWDEDPEKEKENAQKNEKIEESPKKRGRPANDDSNEEPPKKQTKKEAVPSRKLAKLNKTAKETKGAGLKKDGTPKKKPGRPSKKPSNKGKSK